MYTLLKLAAVTFYVAAESVTATRAASAFWQYDVQSITDCSVVVAGGSLASVAAALSSATLAVYVNISATICFTEITDAPGGQLTSGGVPAIDFGSTYNNFPNNLPRAFGELLNTGAIGDDGKNPGGCTVSTKCFPQQYALEWLYERISSLHNLRVYYNTTIIGATRDATTGAITSITAVQRTPVSGTSGYDLPFSQALPDWYSPMPSSKFNKQVLNFTRFAVVIEATEFGDVLMNSGVRVAQGVETPVENTTQYDDTCGQATAIGFYLSYGDTPSPQPDPAPPGNNEGDPFHISSTSDFIHSIIWRRSLAMNNSDVTTLRQGDLNLIQDSNDLTTQLMWLPIDIAYETVKNGSWAGGVNTTVLASLEARAFGWYHYLLNASETFFPEAAPYLRLNYTAAGTANGLMKFPYLRESRRSQFGIEGFRLCHDFAATKDNGPGCWKPPTSAAAESTSKAGQSSERGSTASSTDAASDYGQGSASESDGFRWVDTIGIGNYGFDVHRMATSVCTLPEYLQYSPDPYPAVPYYLPFRALTSWDAPNLLVAGKSMAQTFFANAVTRLHPEEWVTGSAAGVAAALMVQRGWNDTSKVYANYEELQAALKTPVIGQPLEWT